MLVIIDGDSPVFAACLSNEKDGEVIPNGDLFMYKALDKHIARIVERTNATDYKIFLTGGHNFRKDICSTYKANRDPTLRPKLLEKARDFLTITYNAIMSTDREADDLCCQEQQYCIENDIPCILAHIDKDLEQQVGLHYRWKTHNKAEAFYEIDALQGLYNLYEQCLTGDKGDNIMYYLNDSSGTWKKEYGLGKKGAEEALRDCTTEKELYRTCLDLYQNNVKFTKKTTEEQCTEEDLVQNMHLLYMKRTEIDYWEKP